ncbi:uncharacterized protein LOC115229012 isoform X1 [Octopus sinensis]|uniref:Uncharacterized protein LOC115229012 isoform X1 n=1 Tax=Octopus sinensis TaxID=2607531 RepID=A0A6P7U328_9MOLL|nr:uncharacterized protein LOC115229012 isoform X1 [Octopus sinensis]
MQMCKNTAVAFFRVKKPGSSPSSESQSSVQSGAMATFNHAGKSKSSTVHHRSPIRPFFCCGSELSLVSIVELHERQTATLSLTSGSSQISSEPILLKQHALSDSLQIEQTKKHTDCPSSCQHCGYKSNVGMEAASGSCSGSPPKNKHKKPWSIKFRDKQSKQSRYMGYSQPCVGTSRCSNFSSCEHQLILATCSQRPSSSNFMLTPSCQISTNTVLRLPKSRHHRKHHSKKTLFSPVDKQHHRMSARQFAGSLNNINNTSSSVGCSTDNIGTTCHQQQQQEGQQTSSRIAGSHVDRNTFCACRNFRSVSTLAPNDQLCSSFQQSCSLQANPGSHSQFSLDYFNDDDFNDAPIQDYPPHEATNSDSYQRVHSRVEYTHCLVPDLQQIANCSFYWGVMDRYEAENLLDNKAEGTFLLRDSAQEDFLFSVSFRRYGRSLHARIEQCNHKFSFDCHDPGVFAAGTVCRLIEHYKDPSCCMFFEPMLTRPLTRTYPFSLQHLCRAAICSFITYDKVSELPLPLALKDFLKYYHYKMKVTEKHF